MPSEKTIVCVLAAILVGVIAYYYYSQPAKKQEGFLAAGGMQHLGTILPDGVQGDYERLDQDQRAAAAYPSLDNTLAATDFADLVDSGDQARQLQIFTDVERPLERLKDLTDSYFPTIASKALPFSQAAAKPLTFHHAVNLPRVQLKGKLYEMTLAEAIRGTLPINLDPNVNLIAQSQYKVEDVFNPGYMTSAFSSLHDKLTAGYKNLPQYIASSGSASSGSPGNGVELIMDATL